MTQGHRILVVEDDENLRVALADNLQAEGFEVALASNGAEARLAALGGAFDLVVLDLMLPDTDGYRLCRELRDAQLDSRILMLTARSLDEDVVRGFDAGADDYVTKPYRLALLLARIRALLRRGTARSPAKAVASGSRLCFGDFTLDPESRIVTRGGSESVDLTRKEFDLLRYFLVNPGRALGRQQILEAVWGADLVVDERTVDNFVSSTKKKLGWTPAAGFRIVTVRGVGYRLEIEE
jgi:DNA-binding response OmpR family regulator